MPICMLALLLAGILTAANLHDAAAHIASLGGKLSPDRTEISLAMTWASDSDMEMVAALPQLRRIDLSLVAVTERGLEKLKDLRGVTDLNLYYAEFTTDLSIAHIRGWRDLERLNLRGTDVTDISMEYVGSLTNLRSLDLSFTQVTDNGMEHLAGLSKLEHLALGGNKVSGAGLIPLRSLPGLRSLNLNGTQRRNSGYWTLSITDRDLESIGSLESLETLDIGGTKATDLGIEHLQGLRNLRRLDLSRTAVSARGLEHIASLKLKRLDLWQARRVNDAAAPVLATMTEIEVLDLAETGITDKALTILTALPKLKLLLLHGTRVTPAGLRSFRDARPDCEVRE